MPPLNSLEVKVYFHPLICYGQSLGPDARLEGSTRLSHLGLRLDLCHMNKLKLR